MTLKTTPLEAANISSKHGFFGQETGAHSSGFDTSAYKNLVSAYMGVSPQNLVVCKQVHSNICISVDSPFEPEDIPEADALVTDKAGLALGVFTADCVPVLCEGVKPDGAPIIGAAHAGWRGAIGGVLRSMVVQMVGLGGEVTSFRAAIGPAIQQKSYEVGVDFFSHFMDEDMSNEHFFKQGKSMRHFQFDLPGYVAKKLYELSVPNVYVAPDNTFTETTKFFSYRRAMQAGQTHDGRQISAIVI